VFSLVVGGNQRRILIPERTRGDKRMEGKEEKLQEQLFCHLRTEERPHLSLSFQMSDTWYGKDPTKTIALKPQKVVVRKIDDSPLASQRATVRRAC
jgi:hypothetical protein